MLPLGEISSLGLTIAPVVLFINNLRLCTCFFSLSFSDIIEILVSNHALLSFDITEKSTNGKTPFDWLLENKKLTTLHKDELKKCLLGLKEETKEKKLAI